MTSIAIVGAGFSGTATAIQLLTRHGHLRLSRFATGDPTATVHLGKKETPGWHTKKTSL